MTIGSEMGCCVRPWEPEVGDLVIARIGEECDEARHLAKLDSFLRRLFGHASADQQLPAMGHVVAVDPDWNEPDEDGNLCNSRCHHYYVDDSELGEPRGRWKKVSDHFAAAELRLVYRVKN